MPLDKMTNVEDYQKTHESIILHIKGMPACCILDDDFFGDNKKIHHVTLRGFLNKDEKNGLLFGFTLNILIDKQNLKYVIYPNDEFISYTKEDNYTLADQEAAIKNLDTEPIVERKVDLRKGKAA